MSINRFQKWSKVEKESENSSGLWNDNEEETLKQRNEVRQQWRQQQKVVVKKIRTEEIQQKSIKNIFWLFTSVAFLAVFINYFPQIYIFTNQKLVEWFPPQEEIITENCDSNLKNPCQPSSKKKPIIIDKIQKNLVKMNKPKPELQKAIDMSDGKDANTKKETIKNNH